MWRCSVKKRSEKFWKTSHKNIFAGVSFLTKLHAGNLKSTEAAAGDSLENKVFLEFLQISLGKNMCLSLFLKILEFWGPTTLLKKTPTQVFSCQIYKLFKKNYFEEHLWTSASKNYLKRDSNAVAFVWIL